MPNMASSRQYGGVVGGAFNGQGQENRLPCFDDVFIEGLVHKDTLKELYRQIVTFQRPFTVALDACGLDPVRRTIPFARSPRRRS